MCQNQDLTPNFPEILCLSYCITYKDSQITCPSIADLKCMCYLPENLLVKLILKFHHTSKTLSPYLLTLPSSSILDGLEVEKQGRKIAKRHISAGLQI